MFERRIRLLAAIALVVTLLSAPLVTTATPSSGSTATPPAHAPTLAEQIDLTNQTETEAWRNGLWTR